MRESAISITIVFKAVNDEPGTWSIMVGDQYTKEESRLYLSPDTATDLAISLLSAAKEAKLRQNREPKKAQC